MDKRIHGNGGAPEARGSGRPGRHKGRRAVGLSVAACGALFIGAAALTTGGIRAYLTDTDTATNTFTVGEVVIDTLEPNYPGNGSDEVKDLVALEEVKKDPQIKNTGKNRAVVFSQVDIPMANIITADAQGFRNPRNNVELFNFRTEPGSFGTVAAGGGSENSWHEEWVLMDTEYLNKDGITTTQDAAVTCRRLFGYQSVLDENETSVPVFDVVRLVNVIEGMVDNTTQNIVLTSYAIQAENIADLTTADYDDVMDYDQLHKIYDVYVRQSGNVAPDDGDTSNNQTLIDTTLNVTMTVANTHLRLHTGNAADAKTTTEFKVAYTGTGTAPTPMFVSSDTSVVTVDQNGNIQAVGVGEATIIMTAKNPDTGKTASASVTVSVRDMNAGEAAH